MNFKDIKTLFSNQGFMEMSFTSLEESLSFDVYKTQIESSNTGGMSFLKDHLNKKNPKVEKTYKSAFVALTLYYPAENQLGLSLKTALYAQEKDYHDTLKAKLSLITEELNKAFPNDAFEACVDSKPVLERDLAYSAGLGWVGKNTCILNKNQGSLFYIVEVLTTLKSVEGSPKNTLQTDHCGTCTRCIDSCPTDALQPRKLIVDKCISYRNIEDKDCSPETLKKPTHSWFFGCDICQTVCPWNEKVFGKSEMEELNKNQTPSAEELKSILSSSHKELMKKYKEFPLSRARGTGLKRNALKIIFENNMVELKDFLEGQVFSEQLEGLRREVIGSLSPVLRF